MNSKTIKIFGILLICILTIIILYNRSEGTIIDEIKKKAILDSSKITEVVKYIKLIRDTIQVKDTTRIQIIIFSNNNSMYLRFNSEFIQLSNFDVFNFLSSNNILFVEDDGFFSKFEMSAYGDDEAQYYIYYSETMLNNTRLSNVSNIERLSNKLYLVTTEK